MFVDKKKRKDLIFKKEGRKVLKKGKYGKNM